MVDHAPRPGAVARGAVDRVPEARGFARPVFARRQMRRKLEAVFAVQHRAARQGVSETARQRVAAIEQGGTNRIVGLVGKFGATTTIIAAAGIVTVVGAVKRFQYA